MVENRVGLKEIVKKLETYNNSYRVGKPLISDKEYDTLIETLTALDPNNDFLKDVGFKVEETRKSRLPIEMASMNKVKTLKEINDWSRLKKINKEQIVVITPKYDGISLCVDESSKIALTRGDGVNGQRSSEHYKQLNNKLKTDELSPIAYSYGEVMIPKKIFIEKYSTDFANPRNLVAGLFNGDEDPSEGKIEILKDAYYIKYGAVLNDDCFSTKHEILDYLNDNQDVQVPYSLVSIKSLTEKYLFDLFKKWSDQFEIDGLIIEVDYLQTQEQLGRETSSNNPVWARAYKSSDFEQSAETEVIGITWNISKQGFLKPTLHVNPIKLDGVTVSNVTGNNARFVKDMGLGIGAKVVIKRSGMVIPLIVSVTKTVEFQMPHNNEMDYVWNENGVELMTMYETDEQRFKQTVSFFEILEVDSVGEGVIRQLWDAGFNSVKSILELTPDKLYKLEGFGKRKASIVCNAIKSKSDNIPLSKLQHATGFFKGLGSKKLLLLEHFDTKPTIDEVTSIEGFAETSAQYYLDSYDLFFDFIKDLPLTIKKNKPMELVSNDLEGKTFVFTGIRRADLEDLITSRGGKIGSSVSKNTTYLVMKSKGSGSSKETKATSLGVEILTVDDLEKLIK